MSWRHHLLLPLLVAPIVAVVEDVFVVMGLLPDTQNCGLRMRQECRERFPRHRLQRKPRVSDPDMHHGTCLTHVPWCMSGSLTRDGGENIPGIPGACATCNFRYLARGPLVDATWESWRLKNKNKNKNTTAPHYWLFVRWIRWSPLMKKRLYVIMSPCLATLRNE